MRASASLALHLLRSHVLQRAQDGVFRVRALVTGVVVAVAWRARLSLARPKSSSLTPVLRHQDVGRLEIAVHDALAVRRIERLGDLDGTAQRLLQRERAGRWACPSTYSITR